jgi:hypothetical protein
LFSFFPKHNILVLVSFINSKREIKNGLYQN